MSSCWRRVTPDAAASRRARASSARCGRYLPPAPGQWSSASFGSSRRAPRRCWPPSTVVWQPNVARRTRSSGPRRSSCCACPDTPILITGLVLSWLVIRTDMLDPLLRRFFEAGNESEAECELNELMEQHALPLAKAIVGRKLRSYRNDRPGSMAADRDDVV